MRELLCGAKAVGGEGLLDGGGEEPGEEGVGGLAVGGALEDDCGLADLGVGVAGNGDVGAGFAEVGGAGDGEGDEGSVGVAGVSELGGLRDVFGDDQPGLELLSEVKCGEAGHSGAAVRGVLRVSDGQAPKFGAGEGVEEQRLDGGVLAGPEDEFAAGVEDGGGVGEVGGEKAVGEGLVRGEEEVLRGAVFDLLRERGGGTVTDDEVCAGGLFVLGGEGGEDGLEVGGRGDAELWLLGFRGGSQQREEQKEQRAGEGHKRCGLQHADARAAQGPRGFTVS